MQENCLRRFSHVRCSHKDALVQRLELINIEEVKKSKETIEQNIDGNNTKRYGYYRPK